MATILDGKTLSEKLLNNIKNEIIENNYKPSLAVTIVGEDSASQIYVKRKNETAQLLGINSNVLRFAENISQNELETEIKKLADDQNTHAILVQLPLPKHIDTQKIIETIPPQKDVDGFHPYNLGQLFSGNSPYATACTPKGIMTLLSEYNIDPAGKNVVIVGRSTIVGKPLAALFINANATVTICHSKTQNLKEICKTADILVSAIGKAKFFNKDFIKENAIVIDVGINRKEDGKLTGDIDFEDVKNQTSHITPVPKGVGPMTIATLMQNTLDLYKNFAK